MESESLKFICGVEFFRLPDRASLDVPHYYECLKALRPLLDGDAFKAAVLRFYINYITVPDDNGSCLRLVYDTVDPAKIQDIIRAFAEGNRSKIAIFDSAWTNRPDSSKSPEVVGEENLRFRNFLHVNTLVFLGVLDEIGVEPLQRMIYQYRHIALAQRIPPDVVLGGDFAKSAYFQKLKKEGLDRQYWDDLVYFFNNSDFGLHFFVNMCGLAEGPYDRRFFAKDWIVSA